jgi:hypothetical protein
VHPHTVTHVSGGRVPGQAVHGPVFPGRARSDVMEGGGRWIVFADRILHVQPQERRHPPAGFPPQESCATPPSACTGIFVETGRESCVLVLPTLTMVGFVSDHYSELRQELSLPEADPPTFFVIAMVSRINRKFRALRSIRVTSSR